MILVIIENYQERLSMKSIFSSRKPLTKYGLRRVFFWVLVVLAGVVLFTGLGGCGGNNTSTPVQNRVLNIGLILGSAGLGDKSFNDSAYQGVLEAQKKLNVRFETVTYSGTQSDVDALRMFAQKKFDLIVGVAFENQNNIQTVAGEFPGIKFAAIDFELAGDNIASIVYREQEADFLMGALDAMITKTKKIGVIGGADIPAIRRIISGFTHGASYQDVTVEVFTDIAGTFSEPQVGYNLAVSRYNQGVDVIHNAASKTGLGIIQAAQELGKYTTGTSGDQRYLAPGYMIGNRPKRVDTAVQMLIDEVSQGVFKAGVRSLGLKENGLALGPFDETIVTPAMLNRLDEIKQKIISGDIKIQSE
jgi:basic membrane protein A and related proteins